MSPCILRILCACFNKMAIMSNPSTIASQMALGAAHPRSDAPNKSELDRPRGLREISPVLPTSTQSS